MVRLHCYTVVFTCLIFTSVINAAQTEVEEESHFSYHVGSATGPENWGNVKPEWSLCKTGKLQSPVDLSDKKRVTILESKTFERTYHSAPGVIKNRGHDIMIRWDGNAGYLKLNGTEYNLIQAHWHTPSEHKVAGKSFAMELHMVHQSSTDDLAVVGILYDIGSPDPFLGHLLDEIKSVTLDPNQPDHNATEISAGRIEPNEIKYVGETIYRYYGSLTVPPCSEGVTWTLFGGAATVSKEQIAALKKGVHDGYEANARPIQNSV